MLLISGMTCASVGSMLSTRSTRIFFSSPEPLACTSPCKSVRNYERGRSLPGLVNLVCLSSALGVSMDEYTGMKGKYNIPQ